MKRWWIAVLCVGVFVSLGGLAEVCAASAVLDSPMLSTRSKTTKKKKSRKKDKDKDKKQAATMKCPKCGAAVPPPAPEKNAGEKTGKKTPPAPAKDAPKNASGDDVQAPVAPKLKCPKCGHEFEMPATSQQPEKTPNKPVAGKNEKK